MRVDTAFLVFFKNVCFRSFVYFCFSFLRFFFLFCEFQKQVLFGFFKVFDLFLCFIFFDFLFFFRIGCFLVLLVFLVF